MVIKLPFTSIVYNVYEPDADNPMIAHKCEKEIRIYEGRVTSARIAREIPKNATVRSVTKHNATFKVDGDKALEWLMLNGELED